MRILIINPNSSKSITDAIRRSLAGHPLGPGVSLDFWNPSSGPAGISDPITAQESTDACMSELLSTRSALSTEAEGVPDIASYDGALVCCFSEHPLIATLSEALRVRGSRTAVMGMFHAGLTHALLLLSADLPAEGKGGGKFGILATGTGRKVNQEIGVANYTGTTVDAPSSKYAGSLTTGLAIVELQEGDQGRVERLMKESAAELARRGATVLILGCAGMSGMEEWVREGARRGGVDGVRVVDGTRAGVELLIGLSRTGA